MNTLKLVPTDEGTLEVEGYLAINISGLLEGELFDWVAAQIASELDDIVFRHLDMEIEPDHEYRFEATLYIKPVYIPEEPLSEPVNIPVSFKVMEDE